MIEVRLNVRTSNLELKWQIICNIDNKAVSVRT